MATMTNNFIWSKICSHSKRMVLPKWLKADSQPRSLSSAGRHDVIKYQMSKTFEMGVWEILLQWHKSLGYYRPWCWNPAFIPDRVWGKVLQRTMVCAVFSAMPDTVSCFNKSRLGLIIWKGIPYLRCCWRTLTRIKDVQNSTSKYILGFIDEETEAEQS